MSKKLWIYVGAIIIIIITSVIYTCKIFNKAKSVPTVTDAQDVNNMTNKIEEEQETINSSKEENKDEKEIANSEEPKKETKEEQAKKIVQNNWGEDDTVYYSYDGIDANGNYIICVREKATTKALYWYYVDLESGSFEIK